MNWLDLLKVLGPAIVATTVPGGALLAPLIIQGIQEAEGLKGATGPEKKAHVVGLVRAGITTANLVAKKDVLSPTESVATVSAAIDAVVGAVNLVQQATEALRPSAPPAA